ncbi:unnamed protein product [Linum trigynum]|uniref:RNase H type-1 domain-containing protein n=1 Tax=Linum trigynum TaxID=586398 RepID=A0AAV2E9B7_9ROSI
MVIKNHIGAILLASGVQFPLIDDPMTVELLVCSVRRLFGFSKMRFEGDVKVVIEKIIRADVRNSRIGAILEEVVHLFTLHAGFSVRFVGRSNNRVAYLMARNTLSLYQTASRFFDFQTWLHSRCHNWAAH